MRLAGLFLFVMNVDTRGHYSFRSSTTRGRPETIFSDTDLMSDAGYKIEIGPSLFAKFIQLSYLTLSIIIIINEIKY